MNSGSMSTLNRNRLHSLSEIMQPRHNFNMQMSEASQKSVVYVHAPSGCGKSTAVRLWLNANTFEYEWIDLSKNYNTPPSFLKSLCEKFAKLQPSADEKLCELVSDLPFDMAPWPNTMAVIKSLIVNNTVNNTMYAVVFDDFHSISDETTIKILLDVLNVLRAYDNFLFIFISQYYPHERFSEFECKNNMTVIDEKNLKFTVEETKSFLSRHGHKVNEKDAMKIVDKTGGLGIALNMRLKYGNVMDDEDISTEQRMTSYLKTKMWDTLPDEKKEFTMKASILRKMKPDVCDKIFERNDSADILEELYRTNTFTKKIDSIYRFDDIFRRFLNKTLEKHGRIDEQIYRKAARLLLEEKDFSTAAELYKQCKDFAGAEDVLYKYTEYAAKEGISSIAEHIDVYKRLIEGVMPIERMVDYPFVFSYSAWAAYLDGKTDVFFKCADIVREQFPKWADQNPERARTTVLLLFLDPRDRIISIAESESMKAFSIPKAAWEYIPSLTQNLPFYHRSYRDHSELAENMDESIENHKKALRIPFGDEYTEITLACARSGLLLEKGELKKALDHAKDTCKKLKNESREEIVFCAKMILADIYHKNNNSGLAKRIQNEIEEMLKTPKGKFFRPNFNAYCCRLDILSGNTDAAHKWLKEQYADETTQLSFYLTYRDFTTAIAYLVTGEYENAIYFLEKMQELFTVYNRPLDRIETYILLAIAYWNNGKREEALAALGNALDIAYKYEFTSVFVYSGMGISGMLRELYNTIRENKDADKNLRKFIRSLEINIEREQRVRAPAVIAAPIGDVSELKERYKDIARGWDRHLGNKEIAAELFCSVNTIKKDIKNLYDKLGLVDKERTPRNALIKIKEWGVDIYS
jgi:LuxR family maltose regulon positive regulatory protein